MSPYRTRITIVQRASAPIQRIASPHVIRVAMMRICPGFTAWKVALVMPHGAPGVQPLCGVRIVCVPTCFTNFELMGVKVQFGVLRVT